MDGWMDGWMDGSIDGWMDGVWMDGWKDGRTERRMDDFSLTDGWMSDHPPTPIQSIQSIHPVESVFDWWVVFLTIKKLCHPGVKSF